jgi:hypothetical protein
MLIVLARMTGNFYPRDTSWPSAQQIIWIFACLYRACACDRELLSKRHKLAFTRTVTLKPNVAFCMINVSYLLYMHTFLLLMPSLHLCYTLGFIPVAWFFASPALLGTVVLGCICTIYWSSWQLYRRNCSNMWPLWQIRTCMHRRFGLSIRSDRL